MGALQERITTTQKGSITSVQAIYVPADDLTDPAPATSFAHLDATTTLSRSIAEKGIYPAVDPLDSTSRMHRHPRSTRDCRLRNRRHGLGGIDRERWAQALDQLALTGAFRDKARAGDAFTDAYLPPAGERMF